MQRPKGRPDWENDAVSAILDLLTGVLNGHYETPSSLKDAWILTGESIGIFPDPGPNADPAPSVIDPDHLDF